MDTTQQTVSEVDMASNRSSITTVTDASKLDSFALNPFNIRDLSHITIEPISSEVKNEDGTVQRQTVIDENGHITGFQLAHNAMVSPEYRAKFNEFVDSLVRIVDGKAIYKAVMPFKTTSKQPAFDRNKEEGLGGKQKEYWTVLEGNTRLHILKCLVNYLGADGVEFEFSYFIDPACDNTVEYLMASPDGGNNSSVPILGTATTQAEKAYDYALTLYKGDKEQALKFVKKVLELSKRSPSFYTYFKTIKLDEKYLDEVASSVLAFGEIQYRFVLYWRDKDETKPKGTTLADMLDKASMSKYIEWLSYKDLSQFPRITSRSRLSSYTEWADKILNPVVENDDDESDSDDNDDESEQSDDSSNTDSETESSAGYTYTDDDLITLSNSFFNISEALTKTDQELIDTRKPDIIKVSKSVLEMLLNTDDAREVLEFLGNKAKTLSAEKNGRSLSKVQKTADKVLKALFR